MHRRTVLKILGMGPFLINSTLIQTFNSYVDLLRYYDSKRPSKEVRPKAKEFALNLASKIKTSKRFGFNPVLANLSAQEDIDTFVNVYYKKWEEKIPNNVIYHGKGDNGWYNIAANTYGLEFFDYKTRFYALLPFGEGKDLESTSKEIKNINELQKNNFELIPLVIHMATVGYKVNMNLEEAIAGDLIWVQDTMREKGLNVNLFYPNCTAPKLKGYEKLKWYEYEDNEFKIVSNLDGIVEDKGRKETLDNGLEIIIIPSLFL